MLYELELHNYSINIEHAENYCEITRNNLKYGLSLTMLQASVLQAAARPSVALVGPAWSSVFQGEGYRYV